MLKLMKKFITGKETYEIDKKDITTIELKNIYPFELKLEEI